MLSRIYNAAGERGGQIPEACNPSRLAAKNRERRRERFLTDAELQRLGRVLDEAGRRKGISIHAGAAIRLLTGFRKGEILDLRWDEVDVETRELKLPNTKTGPRTIALPREAADVFASVPRVEGNRFVIPGKVKRNPPYRVASIGFPYRDPNKTVLAAVRHGTHIHWRHQ